MGSHLILEVRWTVKFVELCMSTLFFGFVFETAVIITTTTRIVDVAALKLNLSPLHLCQVSCSNRFEIL